MFHIRQKIIPARPWKIYSFLSIGNKEIISQKQPILKMGKLWQISQLLLKVIVNWLEWSQTAVSIRTYRNWGTGAAIELLKDMQWLRSCFSWLYNNVTTKNLRSTNATSQTLPFWEWSSWPVEAYLVWGRRWGWTSRYDKGLYKNSLHLIISTLAFIWGCQDLTILSSWRKQMFGAFCMISPRVGQFWMIGNSGWGDGKVLDL